ncbi:hypothetical protein LINPERPRIM_LOCUS14672 [Linum perenne]
MLGQEYQLHPSSQLDILESQSNMDPSKSYYQKMTLQNIGILQGQSLMLTSSVKALMVFLLCIILSSKVSETACLIKKLRGSKNVYVTLTTSNIIHVD